MKPILVTFILIVLNHNLFSQFLIKGVITDSGSEPVYNALVELTDQADSTRKFSVYSDEHGRYAIQINATGLDNNQSLFPTAFELLQNYPNPFCSSTIIAYEITPPAVIHIDIYNILGYKIKVLFDGIHTENTGWIEWDATDNSGQRVTPGVYIYSMQVNGIKKNKKMILANDLPGTSNSPVPYKPVIKEIRQNGLAKSASNHYILRVSGDSMETFEQEDIEITGNTTLDVSVYRTIKDIDGNVYRIIKIGNQWWMAENLKVEHYRNGNAIPDITDQSSWSSLTSGAYCSYNNDPENTMTYGRLYNRYAVDDTIGLAPEGWHVSSDKDWLTLELFLGDVESAGGKLKETGTLHWHGPNTAATNSFKFSALPGGYREGKDGLYKDSGTSADFWCSTEHNSDSSWVRVLKHDTGELIRLNKNRANGLSVRCVRGTPNDKNAIARGYYLLQGVNSYYTSAFGCISTAKEADSIINVLKKHQVSGVEYGSAYYHPEDISACITVAQRFKQNGIDLWLSSGLQGRVHAFNNDIFPGQYRAYSMTSDGYIVPAFVRNVANQSVIAFDAMNPEAVSWLLNRYKQVYLKPLAPYTSGYFFDEECLYYAGDHANNSRIDYWELAAYSDAVLSAWQKYCMKKSVTYNNSVVTKFPVHSESMVPNGGGKTQYFPGYNVPLVIDAGTPLISIPRNTGVWKAWDEFVTTQYVETWIGGLSRAVYEANIDNPDFKGVIYFGLHNWSLGYEEVTDPSFIVDSYNKWVPWGTQRGVQLSKICALPYIDHIICETFPPIRDNLYNFISNYKRISTNYHKTFGVMLHRDDNWGLDGWDSENDRWAAIDYFKPAIIARYPINRLFPTDLYYNETKENLFDERLLNYRH